MGLMPFLHTCRSSARQERVRRLARYPGMLATAAGALALLPDGLKRGLVRTAVCAASCNTVRLARHVHAALCVCVSSRWVCRSFVYMALAADVS